ncbi:MAG: hypothetical protein AB1644_07375 [Candidatus Zixiibacteriota bacterium]
MYEPTGANARPGRSLFVAYFLAFLTILAPLHSIAHLPASCSDNSALDNASLDSSLWRHDQDRCQLCRTGGHPEFLPMIYATPLHASITGAVPAVPSIQPANTLAAPTSPRSPPTWFTF